MKVFYSSSFFGGFLFLIRSPTKNPLTFGRKCQMVILALPYRAMVSTFYKNLPPKKVLHFEKSRLKIPLVMGRPPSSCSGKSQLELTDLQSACRWFPSFLEHLFSICDGLHFPFVISQKYIFLDDPSANAVLLWQVNRHKFPYFVLLQLLPLYTGNLLYFSYRG